MRQRVVIFLLLLTSFGSGCSTWKLARDKHDIAKSNEIKQHYWKQENVHREPTVLPRLKNYRIPLPPYEDAGVKYEGGMVEMGWYE